jgi:hypothetical protein
MERAAVVSHNFKLTAERAHQEIASQDKVGEIPQAGTHPARNGATAPRRIDCGSVPECDTGGD